MQGDLFRAPEETGALVVAGDLPSGLLLIPEFILPADEGALLAALDDPAAVWDLTLRRRVQHFGIRYNYASRRTIADAPPIPAWAAALGTQLVAAGHFARPPEQLIVNEYLPGQGIAPHVDREVFGPVVASLSLGSDVVMDLRSPNNAAGSILLSARSLLVLSAAARNQWTHGIASRRRDTIAGTSFARRRRVSLTFRTINS